MSILLQDSSLGVWALGVTDGGLLTTTSDLGTPTTLFLNDASNNTWQVGVLTSGLVTTTAVSFSSNPTSFALSSVSGIVWAFSVTTGGLLQSSPGFLPGLKVPWMPNGFGAGTDNRVIGGGGGYMAYPQPANPASLNNVPEDIGQFEELVFSYDSSTSSGKGNQFVIFNPGGR